MPHAGRTDPFFDLIEKKFMLRVWSLIPERSKANTPLPKVSDRNSFRLNQDYSDSFWYLYPSQCESFWTNPKNVLYLVWWKTVKNQSDLIRLISRSIGMKPNLFETKFSIRINPNSEFGLEQSELVLIRIENLVSDSFG